MSKYLTLISYSVLIWLIPLLVSFGFYDQSGKLISHYLVFKLTMILVSTAVSFFLLRRFYKKYGISNYLLNSVYITLIQVILDIPVLLIFLKMDTVNYLLTVLPVYLVMIPVVNYYIAKKMIGN